MSVSRATSAASRKCSNTEALKRHTIDVQGWISLAVELGVFLEHPAPTPNRSQLSGISIEWLALLEQSLLDSELIFTDTEDVYKQALQAALERHPGCSLLDLIPPEHVGRASVYVSHSWDESFSSLVEGLRKDFDSKWQAHLGYVNSKDKRFRMTSTNDLEQQLPVIAQTVDTIVLAPNTKPDLLEAPKSCFSSKRAIRGHEDQQDEPQQQGIATNKVCTLATYPRSSETQLTRLPRLSSLSQQPAASLPPCPLQQRHGHPSCHSHCPSTIAPITHSSMKKCSNILIAEAAAVESKPCSPHMRHSSSNIAEGLHLQHASLGALESVRRRKRRSRMEAKIASEPEEERKPGSQKSGPHIVHSSPRASSKPGIAHFSAEQLAPQPAHPYCLASSKPGTAQPSGPVPERPTSGSNLPRACLPAVPGDAFAATHASKASAAMLCKPISEEIQGTSARTKSLPEARALPNIIKHLSRDMNACGTESSAPAIAAPQLQQASRQMGSGPSALIVTPGMRNINQGARLSITGMYSDLQALRADRAVAGWQGTDDQTKAAEDKPAPCKPVRQLLIRKQQERAQLIGLRHRPKLIATVEACPPAAQAHAEGHSKKQVKKKTELGQVAGDGERAAKAARLHGKLQHQQPRLDLIRELHPLELHASWKQQPQICAPSRRPSGMTSMFGGDQSIIPDNEGRGGQNLANGVACLPEQLDLGTGAEEGLLSCKPTKRRHLGGFSDSALDAEQVKQQRLVKQKQQLNGFFIWIDIFCLPKQQSTPQSEEHVKSSIHAIARIIQCIGRVVVMLDKTLSVLSRSWMLYEVWTTLRSKRTLYVISVFQSCTRPQTGSLGSQSSAPAHLSLNQGQLPAIELTTSEASNSLQRHAIMATWMTEVESPKSSIASLENIATLIRNGLEAAREHEQKRTMLVSNMYLGLGRCRHTWQYDDGTQPLKQDVISTIDAFKAIAKTQCKQEMARNAALQVSQDTDPAFHLWQLMKFTLNHLMKTRDEPLWINHLKRYVYIAERTFSACFANGVVEDMMRSVGGSFDLQLMKQWTSSLRGCQRLHINKAMLESSDSDDDAVSPRGSMQRESWADSL